MITFQLKKVKDPKSELITANLYNDKNKTKNAFFWIIIEELCS